MSSSASSRSQPPTLDALARVLGLIMLAMGSGVVLIAAVVSFTVLDEPGPLWPVLTTLAIGAVLFFGATTTPARQLKAWAPAERPDPDKAGGQLRSTAFITMVMAEAPVLFGVVNGVVGGGWLPVLVGAAISVTGIALAGPTRARLASWVARLESAGARTGL